MAQITELLALIERDLDALGISTDQPWRDVRRERVRIRKTGQDSERILAGGVSLKTESLFNRFIESIDVVMRDMRSMGEGRRAHEKVFKRTDAALTALVKLQRRQGLTMRMVDRVVATYFDNRALMKKLTTRSHAFAAAFGVLALASTIGGAVISTVAPPTIPGIMALVSSALGAYSYTDTPSKKLEDNAKRSLDTLRDLLKALNKSLLEDKAQLRAHEKNKRSKQSAKARAAASWAGLDAGTDLGQVGEPSPHYRYKKKKA